MGRGQKIPHKRIDGIECKKCYACTEYLPLINFTKFRERWDGLNPQCSGCRKIYRAKHRAHNTEMRKKWRESHRIQDRATFKKYYTKRLATPQGKLYDRIIHCMRKVLVTKTYSKRWNDHLWYSTEDLKNKLESQFTSVMSWTNYGSYWHIDHIVPDNLFNYKTADDIEFKMAWDLDNLRPLSQHENCSRQDFVTPEVISKLQELNKKYHYNKEITL